MNGLCYGEVRKFGQLTYLMVVVLDSSISQDTMFDPSLWRHPESCTSADDVAGHMRLSYGMSSVMSI